MRITKIELAGRVEEGENAFGVRTTLRPRAFAIITRSIRDDFIGVEILVAGGEKTHSVDPTCEDDLWSMAKCLQEQLEGCRGTRSDTMDYFRVLQQFAD